MSQIESFRNNCTLIAVRQFADRSEEEILVAFRQNGYRDHRGMYHHNWLKAAKQLGLEIEELPYRDVYRLTVAQFIKKFPKGDFFVTISGHALCIRDGRVLDPNTGGKMRALVRMAERVTNARREVAGNRVKFEKFPGYGSSAARERRRNAYYFAMSFNRENGAFPTVQELVRQTKMTKADINWDVKRGAITLVK